MNNEELYKQRPAIILGTCFFYGFLFWALSRMRDLTVIEGLVMGLTYTAVEVFLSFVVYEYIIKD